MLFLLVLPFCLVAQQKTEYNRKGDDAMKRRDYRDARMWYEEGVQHRDSYSINQLTAIWQANEKMRPSMRSLMNKCLNCLNVKATEGDTTAISKLIIYYTDGIGVDKSEELATYWETRLETFRKSAEIIVDNPVEAKPQKPNEPMKFFLGYAYSMESPYGLTVGGVKNHLGWYVRFRSNFSFADYTGECRGRDEYVGTVPDDLTFRFTGEKKTNSFAGTAGIVLKCMPWLYTSLGLGYGSRELLCQYKTLGADDYRVEQLYWAKNLSYSYDGLAADVDVIVKLGPIFLSAGCNTINFKYVDLNAGLGVFF